MTKLSRKFLEALGKLEKEDIDSILDAHSESTGAIKNELETAQTDLKTAKAENDNLKTSLKERDTQLEDLKKSDDNPETLKAKIKELQEKNTSKELEHTNEMKKLKMDFALEKALTLAKSKNNTAVKAILLDNLAKENKKVEDLELEEDGTIKGLSDILKSLTEAEDTKFLFNTETPQKEVKGATPGEANTGTPTATVDRSKMTYSDLCKLPEYQENNGIGEY